MLIAAAESLSQSSFERFAHKLQELLPSADLWAFGTVAAFFGLLVVAADCVYFSQSKKSLLKLGYAGFWRTVVVMSLWGIGAGLIGVLGAVFGLFQTTQQASQVVGIAWPVILPRLLQSATTAAEDEQAG